jgi:periplasmic protein TonB
MPTIPRSVAASLALHGALLGFAVRGATAPDPLRSTASLTALHATIAVDTMEAPAPGTSSAPPRASVPTAAAAAHDVPRARAPRPRAAAARVTPVAAPSPASPAVVSTPSTDIDPAQHGAAAREVPARTDPVSSDRVPQRAAPTATSGTGQLLGVTHPSVGGRTLGVGQLESSGKGTATPQLADYLKGVRERVTRYREYPYLARRANLEGTVCLRLSIAASGSVLGVTPTCGTGFVPLLQAALKSVSSAAPFPPLPAALGQRLTVDVPVVFELDEL